MGPDMDFPFEDEDHVRDGRALFKQDIAGVGCHLLTMLGKPEPVFKRQALQGTDVQESLCNLLGRSGLGGGCDCGG